MHPPPALVGVVAGVVLVAGVATAALQRGGADLGDRLVVSTAPSAEPGLSRTPRPTPLAVPSEVTPAPVAVPVPLPQPVAVPTTLPPVPRPAPPAATPAPPKPPKPSITRTRQFQGLHGPLPTGCTGPGYACAYSDATGSVPGGVSNMDVQVQSPTTASVRWTGGPGGGPGPQPVGFVLFVHADGAKVHESRHEKGSTSTMAEGLPSGRNLTFYLHELNSEGLSPSHYRTAFTPPGQPPATGSPTPQPSPAP